ncbi:hypothetical protein [Ketobacter sp.]|uniref:hypothetical protein n=1 Tax=Ketobacter sp. TaxID=2083498 RepID=UPI000F21E4C3|nr:hypothetical protein [Ketobacter sp.]RLT96986.1 MAG: hypothetical protein D9N14_13260 [Ketobacter sp.]
MRETVRAAEPVPHNSKMVRYGWIAALIDALIQSFVLVKVFNSTASLSDQVLLVLFVVLNVAMAIAIFLRHRLTVVVALAFQCVVFVTTFFYVEKLSDLIYSCVFQFPFMYFYVRATLEINRIHRQATIANSAPQSEKSLTFEYGPKRILALMTVATVCGIAAWWCWIQVQDPYFMISTRKLSLGITASHYFLYLFMAALLYLVGMATYGLVAALVPKQVTINPACVEIPNYLLGNSMRRVNFTDIANVEMRSGRQGEVLIIHSLHGKARLVESWFPNSDDYMTVAKAIGRRKFTG